MPALRLFLGCLALATVNGPLLAYPPGQALPRRLPPRLDALGDSLPPGAVGRLGTTRLWQPGPVTFLAFDKTGRSLLSLGGTSLRTWEVETGRLLARKPFLEDVERAWPSPDGHYLAASTGTQLVAVHLHTFDGPPDLWFEAALAVQFLVDARQLLIALPDGTVRRRSLDTAKELETVLLPGRRLLCAAFAPDGKSIAAAVPGESADVVRVWDVATAQERLQLSGHKNKVFALLFSPDGKRIASSCTDGSVGVWDATTGKQLHCLEEPPAKKGLTVGVFKHRLAFSADGRLLAATRPGLTIKAFVWDTQTGKLLQTFQSPRRESVTSLAFRPDGKRLALGLAGGGIRVLDIATGRLVAPVGDCIGPVVFAPDSKSLFVTQDGTVSRCDVVTGKQLQTYKGLFPRAVSCSGSYLLISVDDAEYFDQAACGPQEKRYGPGFRAFSVETGKPLWEMRMHILLRHVFPAQTPGTYRDVLAVTHYGSAELLDFATGQTVAPFCGYKARKRLGDHSIVGIAHDLDYFVTRKFTLGSGIFIGPGSNQLLIRGWYNADQIGFPVERPPGESDNGYAIVPLAGGKTLALDSYTNLSLLRHTATETKTLLVTDIQKGGVHFSPDGNFVVAGGEWAGWILWNAITGQTLYQWGAAEVKDPRPVFSADGRILAYVDSDQSSIVLRETYTGRELRRFAGHRAEVTHLAFAPDGRTLASTSEDTTVLLWDVTDLAMKPGQLASWTWTAAELDMLWADLAHADGPRTFAAGWDLVTGGDAVVEFLRKKVPPAGSDHERIAALVSDLNHAKYAKREAANRQLEWCDGSQHLLLQALANKPTLEVRLRIERVLAKLDDPLASPQLLRQWRAVLVLEQIGTPSAREFVEELAASVPEAHLTQAARRALQRLNAR